MALTYFLMIYDLSPVWRFSLEDSSSRRRYGFASLKALVDFLKAELANDEEAPLTKDE